MEDGLGTANTRRAMSRRVERVERGVPVHDETLMRLASVHAIGATTAQRWAARQPVHAWRVFSNWTQPQPGSDGMKVLLTGGAGDLGTVLTPLLEARGDTPLRLDIVPPTDPGGVYVAGSILDRDGLTRWLAGVDSVVHIAAWHGIHETTGAQDVYAFWDLNVTGTMNVFEAAYRAGVTQVVYLSSTSVRHRASLYGHTKVLGEEIAQTYKTRHSMQVVILRPRGFIPHWNRAVYASFVAWLAWFWHGAVHIEDVAHAVVRSLDRLATSAEVPPRALVVDGAYEYTAADLATWDAEGPGSTFKRYYAPYEALVRRYSLLPEAKPWCYDIAETQHWLGYVPRYSLRQALEELVRYGPAGPPGPVGREAPLSG